MATKKEMADAIKKATGADLNADKLTVEKLEELSKLADQGEAGREAFNAKLAEYGLGTDGKPVVSQGDSSVVAAVTPVAGDETPAPKPGAKTKRVRTNPSIAARNGEFTDPETRETIGKDWVDVTATKFVKDLISSGQILEDDED